MKTILRLLYVFLACAAVAPVTAAQPAGTPLDVLNWWTSVSERAAVEQLKRHLAAQGVVWKDAAVAGGGGTSATKVLNTRLLMGDAPDVSPAFRQWAAQGLALSLNTVAERDHWRALLFPEVMEQITLHGQVIAAPLGIHRINSVLYNRPLLARFGLEPPRTWEAFEGVANTLKNSGVRPFAWSDQAWQISSVLEVLLLGEGGPTLYRALIVQRKPEAWLDARVTRALQRLRRLRALSEGEGALVDRPWTDSLRALLDGRVAMMVSGDWARGELRAWGASPEREFGCITAPGTEGMHIFTIDTLAMVKTPRPVQAAQETMAAVLVSAATQRAYNQAKGSVPVRRDANLRDWDACARDSWETFAAPTSVRVPSLALTADETSKQAIGQILVRFVTEPDMAPQEAQRKIALVIQLPEATHRQP